MGNFLPFKWLITAKTEFLKTLILYFLLGLCQGKKTQLRLYLYIDCESHNNEFRLTGQNPPKNARFYPFRWGWGGVYPGRNSKICFSHF